MIGSLTLPAIALLAAISGLPGLPGLKGLPMPASKEYARAKAAAVAADTLPPPWRPSWRLALENRFVMAGLAPIGRPFGPIKLLPAYDPRKVRITVDPDSGSYRSLVEVGGVSLGAGYRRPLDQFSRDLAARTFREHWQERSRRDINTLGTDAPLQRSGISVPIPVHLPQRVQSLLGPGGPALNVSGSETIQLSGTSNWTNQKLVLLGQRQSLFPSLDMQQNLDLRLEGQLSDRIKVNLLQNSANQVPLANRIAINYRGDEDDFIQALDLGNTSLTLPGTQYVSYSGKNEGLFGVKLASRIGPLDMTVLASKQEGRSERAVYSGGGAAVGKFPFSDLDWVKGQYFLLYDPSDGVAYDIDERSIRLYFFDGNGTNQSTNRIPGKAYINPDGKLQMQLSPAETTAVEFGLFSLLFPGADRDYEVLNNVYAFHDTIYKVIRLKSPIPVLSDQILGVTFAFRQLGVAGAQDSVGRTIHPTDGTADTIVMKLLRVPRKDQSQTSDHRFDPSSPLARVRELELKSFYNLGGFGIDAKSFKLTLQAGQGDPPVTALNGIPFLEMVGLDSWNEQTAQPRRGQDGQVDATGFNSQTRGWVDYTNGVLMLPDARPFAPRLAGPDAHKFDQLLDVLVNRRALLDPNGTVNKTNPDAYELYTPQAKDAQWYFTAEYAAARSGGGEITLGRGNILEGSEAVVVNGERWQRDRDYTIDYDLGRVTLKRQLGPTDQLSIDYSYAPLFAQASKTLVGSAFRFEGRDRSLGGAFLYESKGAQDLRPRLGEEPSRTLITDLNTEWRFKPAFLTRFADALPGVRTTTPSELNVQAEAGMSFPNPNTRNEVFVDDMEGVRDAVSLSLTPDRWRWSSVPSKLDNGIPVKLTAFANQKYTEVHWYTPVSTHNSNADDLVHEHDLHPNINTGQTPDNVRTVLALSVPKAPKGFDANNDKLWSGLTYNLDPVGLDLSRSQFIEIWVNDWRDYHDQNGRTGFLRGDGSKALHSVKLHIDLGRVSEDQMRAPNRPPDGRINTEDRVPRDNQLTVTGDNSEDTGLDGINDDAERAKLQADTSFKVADLSTVDPNNNNDPEGDDWGNIDESRESPIDPLRYLHTNGTEGNHTAFPIPDTEDMNLNNQCDQTEGYYEYTIDLGAGQVDKKDSPYLVTDVFQDFWASDTSSRTYKLLPFQNGWRLYRIPLTDSRRVTFGHPDRSLTPHVRVWLEDLPKTEEAIGALPRLQRPALMIGGFDIVGSRWQSVDLTPRQRDTFHTTVTLTSVNSVDDADRYFPLPFDPGESRNGSQQYQRREQSLALQFTDLHPADTLEAFKTFSLPENYSRYGVLNWYAASFQVVRAAPPIKQAGYDPRADPLLFYFVRFASDDKGDNYYEIKRHLPVSSEPRQIAWEQRRAEIATISQVKLSNEFLDSLNQHNRLNSRNPFVFRTQLANGDSLVLKGQPSFTRLLRVSIGVINQSASERFTGQLWFDELRATDVAKDVGVADRVLVNGRWANLMDYNVAWTSRDADFLSVGETRGTGSRNTTLSVSSRFEPHRFFEGTGILVPVSFSQNESSSRPRFSAGDDIVRTGVLATQSETKTVSRSVSASYSRVWSDRSNPFLRYTLGGLNANMSRTTSDSRSPTSISRTTNMSAGVSYQVTPRELLVLPLPFTKTRLYPLPERAYWNYGVSTNKSSTFTRAFGSEALTASPSQNGRAANVDFGADTRPFDLLSHHVEGHRNLSLEGVRLERIGFINFGRLTSWRQSFSSHLALSPSPWIRPSFNWSSNYSQNNDTQSPELGSRSIANGQELGINWDLPFDRLAGSGFSQVHAPVKPDSSGKAAHRPRRPLLPWRGFLSHLGALGADGRIGRNSNYSRLMGTASPLYLVGLAENPGFGKGRVVEQLGSTSSNALDWRGNAHTSVPLAFGSALLTRFSYGDRTNNNNGVVTRNRDWRFPDVEVQYGRVANMIGLARFLDGPQLRTAYARSYSVDYLNSRSVRSATSRSDDWRPLFSVRGRLKNGTDADLRFERRSSVRESFQLGSSRAKDQTTNVNFSLSRSYSAGQKVSLLGKTTTVKTSVNLQLTTVYERQKGGTKIGTDDNLANPIDRTRMSVNGTGSYGFSSNVTGDLTLGFSHFRETNGIVRRSIHIDLRGQFRF